MKKRILALILALALCLSLGLSAIAAGGFDDVADGAWYLKYLDTAVGSGLINGRGGGVFAPDDSITGAEAVKLAACLGQLLSDGEVTLQNGSPWYASYMDYAVQNGIIGSALDEYAAASPIMRADLMDMVCRAIPEAQRTELNSIPDGSIPDVFASAYYSESVYTLYRMGIVTGSDERGSCLPDEYIKRSEVAALIARVVDEDLRVSFSLAEPASALDELRARAENDGALCAAALLGYAAAYDENAATKLYPFLADVPAENRTVVNGDELYFIVPCEGVTAKVYEYAFDWEGGGGYARGALLADYGSEPFTLRCNVSDIVSNTLIVLESADGSVLEYSPYVSLKDGTLGVPDSGVYDFTQY